MRSTLFHTLIPNTSKPQSGYQNFARLSRQLPVPEGSERLAENVWLIDIRDETSLLPGLLRLARENALDARVREVNLDPAWSLHRSPV
jgi:hypothetical protein